MDYIGRKTAKLMLTYRLETEINKPIDEVIRVFRNRDKMAQWQPGLISSELLESEPHPKYKLLMQIGRRKLVMTETILRDELPLHFEGTYEMRGVYNRIQNSFEATGGASTRWISVVEFRFKGMMMVIAFFMKDGFRKQSEIIMSNFKRFVEAGKG